MNETETAAVKVKQAVPFLRAGNAMWVSNLSEPDGHELSFQSPTDGPEAEFSG